MVRKAHLPLLASIASACATCPSISDVNVLSADDGSSSFWGTGLGAYIELTLSATEKGECWFSAPSNVFGNFPACPFSWDYGTVNSAGGNNYSIQFNQIPHGGVAKLGFLTSLAEGYKSSITSGKTDTYSFVTSSGEHKSSVSFNDFPSDQVYCGSCGTQQEGNSLSFDVSVPAAIIESAFTINIEKQQGYKFQTGGIKLYYTQSSNSFDEASNEQLVPSSSITDSSTEDKISIAFNGNLPSGCSGLRLSYDVAVLEEMTYYSSVCNVEFSSFSQQLTAYVYTKNHMGSIETPAVSKGPGCGSQTSSSSGYSSSTVTTLSPSTGFTSSSTSAAVTSATSSSGCDDGCDDGSGSSSSSSSPAAPTSSSGCDSGCDDNTATSSATPSTSTSSSSSSGTSCDSGCDENSGSGSGSGSGHGSGHYAGHGGRHNWGHNSGHKGGQGSGCKS
ncbi:KLTH0H00154p [Lachancea thermotolerans CBS 6340]|uniref:KLTH0H00154p n=1 Tax=Lachancea thermotolerans (strain ATCC 56472 / CBS 6340 / NRRL Y-8284) TaxID=559295 RepID=C5E1W5_LACTC|nr:KLTH0H00154p [Lachancea thermotolerans CBS 6340]CAR30026.1 KLTH0H00154p [Lachancea thermotolerans CBS 6340]